MGHPISGKPHVSHSNQTEKVRERWTKIEKSVCCLKVCVIKREGESEGGSEKKDI